MQGTPVLPEAGNIITLYSLWLSDRPRMIQAGNSRSRIRTQAGWLQSHCFEPLCYTHSSSQWAYWGLFLNLRQTCMILASLESGFPSATPKENYHQLSTYLVDAAHFAYITSKRRFLNLSSVELLDQTILCCGDAVCAL